MFFIMETKMDKFRYVDKRKKLRYEEYLVDGVRYIANRAWYSNGNPRREIYFVNRFTDGVYRTWYSNGQIKVAQNWDMGMLEGEVIYNIYRSMVRGS